MLSTIEKWRPWEHFSTSAAIQNPRYNRWEVKNGHTETQTKISSNLSVENIHNIYIYIYIYNYIWFNIQTKTIFIKKVNTQDAMKLFKSACRRL